jgi:hypothetical protein
MQKNNITLIACCAGSLLVTTGTANAGWFDFLFDKKEELKQQVETIKQTSATVKDLSSEDIATGSKQALEKGVDYAVTMLGKPDGFLANQAVAIPMPDNLRKVDRALRKIGKDKYADQFVTTMNRAAEAAVPLSIDILQSGIRQMTFSDAKNILNGPDDAATRYLQDVGGEQIRAKINPIIKATTAKAGVTRVYKRMLDKIAFMGSYVKIDDYDIDKYVTDKTVAGLFTMVAEQEKLIRDDPKARTTEILKDVFGKK